MEAPRNTLTRTDIPTVLSVAVDMWSFSRDAGTADIVLGAGSQATSGGFASAIRAPPIPTTTRSTSPARAGVRGRGALHQVPIAGNMPNLRVSSGGPNLVAPSPRNVTRPASLAAAVPLPEIPIVPDAPGAPATPTARAGAPALDAPAPDAGSVVRATLLDDPARGGTLRSAGPGTAPDVFEAAAPIAPFAGERPPAADPEYFSQGAFDFVAVARAAYGRAALDGIRWPLGSAHGWSGSRRRACSRQPLPPPLQRPRQTSRRCARSCASRRTMHSALVRRIVVDPAHERLISAGDDKTIRLWQLRTRPARARAPRADR